VKNAECQEFLFFPIPYLLGSLVTLCLLGLSQEHNITVLWEENNNKVQH
jgi:hypothetical protein